MVSEVAHLSFTVSDLERSIQFYRDLLGFKLNRVAERSGPVPEAIIGIAGVRIKVGILRLNDFTLELVQYLSPVGVKLDLRTNNVGCPHLAFSVKDIEATYNHLLGSGVKFRAKPIQIEDGPFVGWKAAYLSDPDGITLELMQSPVG